jgi:hypothetical protein
MSWQLPERCSLPCETWLLCWKEGTIAAPTSYMRHPCSTADACLVLKRTANCISRTSCRARAWSETFRLFAASRHARRCAECSRPCLNPFASPAPSQRSRPHANVVAIFETLRYSETGGFPQALHPAFIPITPVMAVAVAVAGLPLGSVPVTMPQICTTNCLVPQHVQRRASVQLKLRSNSSLKIT